MTTRDREVQAEANAYLDSKDYRTGVKISDAAMREVAITPHSTLPQWNYTISPN